MPIFEDDIRILSKEIKTSPEEGLPPMTSYIITITSFVVALVVTLFFIFPFVRAYFNINFVWGIFISLGTFLLIHFALGEVLSRLIDRARLRYG